MLLFLIIVQWFLTLYWLLLSTNLSFTMFSRCFYSSSASTFNDVYLSTQTPNVINVLSSCVYPDELFDLFTSRPTCTATLDLIDPLRLQRSMEKKKDQP